MLAWWKLYCTTMPLDSLSWQDPRAAPSCLINSDTALLRREVSSRLSNGIVVQYSFHHASMVKSRLYPPLREQSRTSKGPPLHCTLYHEIVWDTALWSIAVSELTRPSGCALVSHQLSRTVSPIPSIPDPKCIRQHRLECTTVCTTMEQKESRCPTVHLSKSHAVHLHKNTFWI